MSPLLPPAEQLTPSGGWRDPGRVRLPPLQLAQASFGKRLFVTAINRLGKLEASNLFLMLMHNFRLLRAWLSFASKLMPFGSISRRDTELVILRVAWNCRSRYEWGQHVDSALRSGVPAEEIARIPIGAKAEGWEPRISALLNACDEFHLDRMVTETTWQALTKHFQRQQMVEVLMLIGHYEMLAGILNSTGLPLDTRLEGVLGAANIHNPKPAA